MAWVHAPQYLWAGTTTDPRELMGNVFELAREPNGFTDRDNLGESVVGVAEVVTGTFNTLGSTEYDYDVSPSSDFDLVDGETGAWREVTAITTNVTCVDGRLLAELWGCYRTYGVGFPAYQTVYEFRLLIDGVPVAESGWISFHRNKTSFHLIGSAPVDVGTHTISLQWRGYGKPHEGITNIANGILDDTTVEPSTAVSARISKAGLVWRHQKR